MTMKSIATIAVCLVFLVSLSTAFAPPSLVKSACSTTSSSSSLFAQNNEEDELPPNNEQVLEQLSREGAARVREMDIAERTKRAMLAEQVEDGIFRMQEKLETLIPPSGIVPEEVREECVEIAQQMRAMQGQYEALVSGKPSTMLSTIENLGKGGDE